MEEKKKAGRPSTKVKENSAVQPQQSKLSYDELLNVANQLSVQNKQLRQQLQQMNMTNLFQRLNYLFKVAENGHMFSETFLNKGINEIEKLMELPDENESVQENESEEDSE